MQHNFWHELWAKGELGFHLDQINPFLKRHCNNAFGQQNGSVFIPLCGKSLDVLWLAKRYDKVIGVELSQRAVDDFFRENKLTPSISQTDQLIEYRCENITVYCGDIFQLKTSQLAGCQFIYDRASLIALPDEMRKRYVAKLQSLFSEGYRSLLVTLDYPQSEMDGPPFAVSYDTVERLFSHCQNIELLESKDILVSAPRFKERGVSQMHEHVFLLNYSVV
jgi:thiopurine S-methyltransferase